MRLPIIAGNWKMNTTVDEAVSLVKNMLGDLERIDTVERVICPPFVSIAPVKAILQGSSVKLGAQNMHFEERGAYTGEVSSLMLSGMCEYVIIGHSERRQYFGETDEIVSRKVSAALKARLKPILCVGESLVENDAGKTEEVVSRQVRKALMGVKEVDGLVIAYEPVWAIGTGKAATGGQANATIALIRRIIRELYGEDIARAVRIQYGGSVTSANIGEFICQPEIDGALVGGASLKGPDFVSIVKQTADVKQG